MKRKALSYLTEWLSSPQRKPLILRGARQVGKTWLVRQFATLQSLHCVELNFEKQPDLKTLFASNDPSKIIFNLETQLGLSIDPQNSLLFLDEIQIAPQLLAKLRWFAEDFAHLPVIAAGSLLDFTLAEHEFSMPVGRVSYCHLEPLSFEEFLLALGKDKLHQFLNEFQWGDEVPKILHEQFLELMKEYFIVGGMPAAVVSWINERSLANVNRIQHDLLATYRDDFAKYAGRLSTQRLNEVMLSVPKRLGEKFVYRRVNADAQSGAVKQALNLLNQARICHIVHCTHANGVPLGAELVDKIFKVIFLDVGLVSAALGLTFHSLSMDFMVDLVNQGGIAEQAVGQLLRTIEPFYIEPKLYYWIRQETGSAAEIDYVIQQQAKIWPLEVKAGSTGGLKSLHLFMALKKNPFAVRVNADLPSRTDVQVKTHIGETVHYHLLSIPFYLVGQLNRLLNRF